MGYLRIAVADATPLAAIVKARGEVCVAEFFCPSARPGPPDRERQGTIRSSRIGTTGTFASGDCDAAAKLSAPVEYSPGHDRNAVRRALRAQEPPGVDPVALSVRCSSSLGSCDARVGDRRSHEASAARGRHKGVRSSSAARRVRSRSRRSCRHRRRKRRSPCAPGTIVAGRTERLEDRRRGRKDARGDGVGWFNDGTSYRRITIDDGELPSVSPRARRAGASTAGARRQAAARRRPCRLELRSI
jgi:hypothetical protein